MVRVWMVSGAVGSRRGDGTDDAEFEVQRTIKKAELTAFLCLFRKSYRSNIGSC